MFSTANRAYHICSHFSTSKWKEVEIIMPKNWTGDLVGLLHDNKISQGCLANHMGLSYQYVSMVLNGRRSPRNARERFTTAVSELVEGKQSGLATDQDKDSA